MKENLKAYCLICKKMVSDDISNDCNLHEHPVTIYQECAQVAVGDAFMPTSLTPQAYLNEASALDAEIIVNAIIRRVEKDYPIVSAFPKRILVAIVEEVVRMVREAGIREEQKARLRQGRKPNPNLPHVQGKKKKSPPGDNASDETI